jgi:hypothetical protein
MFMSETRKWAMPACPVDVRDFGEIKIDPNQFRSAGFGEILKAMTPGEVTLEGFLDGPTLESWRDEVMYARAVMYWERLQSPPL